MEFRRDYDAHHIAEFLRAFMSGQGSRQIGTVYEHRLADKDCRTMVMIGGPCHGMRRVILIEPPSKTFDVPVDYVGSRVAHYRLRDAGYYAFEYLR